MRAASEPGSDDPTTIFIDGVPTDVSTLSWWRRPRRLRRQLAGSLLVIAFLSVTLVGTLNFIAGRRLLDEGTQQKLVGIGEARSRSIETGIDRILAQVSVAAADLEVVGAVEDFTATFDDLRGTELTAPELAELEDFYEQRVIDPIADAGLAPVELDDVLPRSDPARYLQYHYIVADADRLADRREIIDPGDGSGYSAAHVQRHTTLSEIATSLGIGDMLIVSAAENEVVYSVDKRIDLGLDLDLDFGSGSYAPDALVDTVRSKLSRVPVGTAVIADEGIYLPGGGRPVVFVAAQVRRDTEVIGTLVAEVPIEGLNLVTTAGEDWESVGLGDGESYVVGADRRLRSESRLWIEHPDRYLARIDDDALRGLIETFGSPVGLQPVDTEPATAAFEGRTFEGNTKNYLGERTFAYATPIDAPGVNWIVVADVPLSAARAPLTDYAKRLGLVLLIILPSAGLIGYALADRLTRPIPPVVSAAFAVAEGDRNPDIPDLGNDEFGDLARHLKQMANDLGSQEAALADEFERTRQLMLTVLPPRIVANDGAISDNAAADVATVIAVGIDLAHTELDLDEHEIAGLMDQVRDSSEALAAAAGIERVRSAADRYLFLAGLGEPDHGADRALAFAVELGAAMRAFAHDEDAPVVAHVGISTGPVATGVFRQGSLTFGAWGEPVRRASALAALSRGDRALIDDSTAMSVTDGQWALTPATEIISLDGEPMALHFVELPDD